MKYRTLGRTGLKVSEIGYGGEHITDADFETSKSIIELALQNGVNIFDVFMPQPAVREHMGNVLKDYRNDVILQGHIGAVMRDGQYARSRDPEECDVYVNDFLEKFHTDYIDLGMLHFIDTDEDYKAAFESGYIEYVQNLKKDGVIRFIGASSHNAVTAQRMVRTGIVDMLMFSINPAFDLLPAETSIDDLFSDTTYNESNRFEIDPQRAELYRLCEEKNIAITVMKTLAAGRLLSCESSPFGVALTPIQCISYALERPAVSSVMMGAGTYEELEECLKYVTASDTAKDYTIIAKGNRSAMREKCMYCNHCLPCPANIDIASVTKYLDMARQSGIVNSTVGAHYGALYAHGSDCIGCGSCEMNCPFGVKIRENMTEAAKIFGI